MDICRDMMFYCLREVTIFVEENYFAFKLGSLAIVIGLFIYWFAIHPFHVHKKYGIPHPNYHYFLGNFLELGGNGTMVRFHSACMKKFGHVFGFYVGRRPFVAIADAAMMEKVLIKNFSNFHNRGLIGRPKKPMNMGLLNAEYLDWRRIRPTVSPTFSLGKIKQTAPLVLQSINSLVGILEKCATKSETVEIFELYGHMTMEVILSVAFGLETDFQIKGDENLKREADDWFRLRRGNLILDMLPLPFFIKDRLKQFFSPNPAFFLGLLKPVVEKRKKNPSNRKDFLQLLLTENRVDGKPKLTDDDIYASSITFLLAGYETTSNALAYTTYLLALHPDIQERLHKEIMDNEPDTKDGSFYEAVQNLEYLDAVLNESLRLYPPAWITVRNCEEEISLGDYTIPAGVTIHIPIFAIHHCEDFWKDHWKFDPERFSPENKRNINQYHFLPFGLGPRNCIGMRFALIEAKMTLVNLLMKFRFEKTAETEEHPLELRFGITMSPMNGIKVKVVNR